jgi:hypothetical protein
MARKLRMAAGGKLLDDNEGSHPFGMGHSLLTHLQSLELYVSDLALFENHLQTAIIP